MLSAIASTEALSSSVKRTFVTAERGELDFGRPMMFLFHSDCVHGLDEVFSYDKNEESFCVLQKLMPRI
ncbi:hypothetical protein [Sphingopyxis jiangsuensis]|uniref:hypothetical protein n=1 Tax=Sphingopyxis jiangsuensis TaxID=2871171 RepID=UPI001F16A1EA|nr:hypothetical protein [Sphingopyxis lutea]